MNLLFVSLYTMSIVMDVDRFGEDMMRLKKELFIAVLCFSLLSAFAQSACGANPAVSWEGLPLIRTGVKIRSYSSYNPTGRTYRDFMNYTARHGEDYELARYQGSSGMLVQCWFTNAGERFSETNFGNVKLFLSKDDKPDYDKLRDDYFSRSQFPHLQPLWGQASLARWGFPCLGFDSAFAATSTAVPHWYQFTCHLYREDRFSESMNREQVEAWNVKAGNKSGEFPGSDRGNQKKTGTVTINDTTTKVLMKNSKPGVIRIIRIKPSDVASELLDNVWVVIRLDDEEDNAVKVPMSVFFGGYEKSPIARAKGLPCGYDGQKLYCFFPMPFWKSFRLELENKSGGEASFDYEIGYSDVNPYPRESTGSFRIKYNNGVEVKKGQPDFPHLQIDGSGHIVGASANLAGSIEGNFRTYVDGMKTPAIETTGGEDYFCHAFGIQVGLLTPFHGGLNDKIGYRFHIADYVPFHSSIFFGQDHAHDYSHDMDGTFRSAVFYYWNPKQILVQTDSFDVGDVASEKAHEYKIAGGKTRLQNDMAAYEGNFKEPFDDSGQWTSGESSFRVKIDPDNDGVRLRKRINQIAYHQAVEVSVDGKSVGVWFEQGSQYQLFREKEPKPGYVPDWNKIDKRFRDTEFEIPESFTSGKSSIALKMKTLGAHAVLSSEDEGMTNEYYYWIFSYKK